MPSVKHGLNLQSYIWTNHTTSRTWPFGMIRPKQRCFHLVDHEPLYIPNSKWWNCQWSQVWQNGVYKAHQKMAKSVTEWLKKRTKDKWLKERWAKIPTHFDWPIKSYWTHLWYVIDVKVVLKANTSWGVLHSHGAEESPVKSPG